MAGLVLLCAEIQRVLKVTVIFAVGAVGQHNEFASGDSGERGFDAAGDRIHAQEWDVGFGISRLSTQSPSSRQFSLMLSPISQARFRLYERGGPDLRGETVEFAIESFPDFLVDK